MGISAFGQMFGRLRGRQNKPNLLILGASGGVANAFLHHFNGYRDVFNKLVLVDRRDNVLRDQYIDHEYLRYEFVRFELKLPSNKVQYVKLLAKFGVDIVLDLTDANSLEILEATNEVGISYVNTALNNDSKTVKELMFEAINGRERWDGAPHILCTGMNPGNVNMWVRYGIERFGVPKRVVHFEFDTARTTRKWHPLITWSIHEFLVEMVRDPSGLSLGRGRVKTLFPNAIKNLKNLKTVLEPIMKLKHYPDAFTVLHEENLSISHKYDIPSEFLYAIHPETSKQLIAIYDANKNIEMDDLDLGDNTSDILEGSDNIGVILEYTDKKVYYFNSISNGAVVGTNATYTQVTVGIFAALFVLVFDKPKSGVYFVEDLFETSYKTFMFDNLRVQEYVFQKHGRKLMLKKYNPLIKIKASKTSGRHYVT